MNRNKELEILKNNGILLVLITYYAIFVIARRNTQKNIVGLNNINRRRLADGIKNGYTKVHEILLLWESVNNKINSFLININPW